MWHKLYRDSIYLRVLLFRLSLIYLSFSTARVFFFFYNYEFFSTVSVSEFIYILFIALRFDTCSILYINSVFILALLFPFPFKNTPIYKRVVHALFLTTNALVLLIECSGAIYFPYAFRRILRSDFTLMSKDVATLLPEFFREYGWFLIAFLLLTLGLSYLYRQVEVKVQVGTKTQGMVFLLALPLVLIGMRGGTQLRPLTPSASLSYVSKSHYAPLVTNTTLGLIMSLHQNHIENKNYFTDSELAKILDIEKAKSSAPHKTANVVILILESMGREYIGYYNPNQPTYTPFLDSLLAESWTCSNAFANGLRSSQGIVSIMAGFPALMEDPFIFSAYSSKDLVGMGDVLKKQGYSTSFFHPGAVGTMDFNQFAPVAGLDKYYGLENYKAEQKNYNSATDFDGVWGLWDRLFIDYMLSKLAEEKEPFLSCYFSINSHHPYSVEPFFEQIYAELPKLERSILYVDYCLRHFFKNAQKQDWFENTLFVITADHVGKAQTPYFFSQVGRYAIPIAFYHPKDTLLQHKKTDRIAQQIDIFPSVLDYLNSPATYQALGQSVFDTTHLENRYSVVYEGGIYTITGARYLLQFDGEKTTGIYDYRKDNALANNLIPFTHDDEELRAEKELLEQQVKAMIQTHHEVLLENKFANYN